MDLHVNKKWKSFCWWFGVQVGKRRIGIRCWEEMEGECPGRGTGIGGHFRREIETYLNENSMEFTRVTLGKILIVRDNGARTVYLF